jgi:hypothetical protein
MFPNAPAYSNLAQNCACGCRKIAERPAAVSSICAAAQDAHDSDYTRRNFAGSVTSAAVAT